jgi:DNA-binding NarL/FixJ family response regulator
MATPIRVLVVDDDVPTRIGLRSILEADETIVVVAESEDAADAVAKARELHPDIVLMDVQLRGADGITATEQILASPFEDEEPPRVIVLTTFELDDLAYRSLRAGASGFLLKRTRAEDIVDAIHTVAEGSALPFPAMARELIGHFATSHHSSVTDVLTERECEVLLLIARGYSNQEIGAQLNIRLDTVKSHIKHVFYKLGVRDRAQAVIAAYESGLVSPGIGVLDADQSPSMGISARTQ